MKRPTWLLALLGFTTSCDHGAAPQDGASVDGFYISTESETAARAAAVLPAKGSEDASHILAVIDLPAIRAADDDQVEYLPSPNSEWVVDVELSKPNELEAAKVAELFRDDSRGGLEGLTVYGKDARTGRWTFLVSAEPPERISALKFAWPHYESWSEDPAVATKDQFQANLDLVTKQVQSIAEVGVRPNLSPADAAKRSQELAELCQRPGLDAVLQLKAPPGSKFEGKEVWDVMLSLGLQWGDMDCFHWENESGNGDDYFFSVQTSTPPGYFLPEEIVAGRVQVDDLIFVYRIPRSADPESVFERMFAAAEYARSRLGGQVLDGDGQPARPEETKKSIRTIARELEALGFRPGSDAAMRFF